MRFLFRFRGQPPSTLLIPFVHDDWEALRMLQHTQKVAHETMGRVLFRRRILSGRKGLSKQILPHLQSEQEERRKLQNGDEKNCWRLLPVLILHASLPRHQRGI